jgi:pimeloyl-ACP methyl ester carboxylesterase
VRPEALVAVQQGLGVRPDSVETAKTIRVPSCVIAAGEDPVASVADLRMLADTIRMGGGQAEFHEIPDAGHFAPWEQPETVGRILRKFFDGVR